MVDKQLLAGTRTHTPAPREDEEGGFLGDMMRRLCTYGPVPRTAGTYGVGVTTLRLGGGAMEVWYPTLSHADEKLQIYARLWRGLASRDAPLRKERRWPLLVMSHGLRGDRYDLSWLAEGLAAEGYIVVAPEHLGSTHRDFDRREALKLWRRAVTLSRTISVIAAHPKFEGAVDLQRCAVAGHSAGGSTGLVMAGARINPQLYGLHLPFASQVEDGSWRDARVRAVVALAPGTGFAFDATGLKDVQSPVLIVSGTQDTVTPDKSCAEHYTRYIPNATWHSLVNVGHYTYKPQPIRYGYLRARGICVDHPTVDRARVHKQIIMWTSLFLQEHLA